jgi:hypothetical protein
MVKLKRGAGNPHGKPAPPPTPQPTKDKEKLMARSEFPKYRVINGRRVNTVGNSKNVEYITNLDEMKPTYFAPEFRQGGESCKYEWLDTNEHFQKLKWHRAFQNLPTDAEMLEMMGL